MKFISISEAMKRGKGRVAVRGWVYRERGSNEFKFIILRDSTDVIQCVLKKENFKKQWTDIDKLQVESSLEKIKRIFAINCGFSTILKSSLNSSSLFCLNKREIISLFNPSFSNSI